MFKLTCYFNERDVMGIFSPGQKDLPTGLYTHPFAPDELYKSGTYTQHEFYFFLFLISFGELVNRRCMKAKANKLLLYGVPNIPNNPLTITNRLGNNLPPPKKKPPAVDN